MKPKIILTGPLLLLLLFAIVIPARAQTTSRSRRSTSTSPICRRAPTILLCDRRSSRL